MIALYCRDACRATFLMITRSDIVYYLQTQLTSHRRNLTMPFATASDGVRLYYEEIGQGEPLLLINGQGGDHTGWDGVRDDFAGRYHVIVFDHRGTGQSDKPNEPPYSTRGFAQDAISILDHLKIPRSCLWYLYGRAYRSMAGHRTCRPCG